MAILAEQRQLIARRVSAGFFNKELAKELAPADSSAPDPNVALQQASNVAALCEDLHKSIDILVEITDQVTVMKAQSLSARTMMIAPVVCRTNSILRRTT